MPRLDAWLRGRSVTAGRSDPAGDGRGTTPCRSWVASTPAHARPPRSDEPRRRSLVLPSHAPPPVGGDDSLSPSICGVVSVLGPRPGRERPSTIERGPPGLLSQTEA